MELHKPNILKLSEEEYEAIETMGACNYAPRRIATYLSIPEKDFLEQWLNEDSLVRYHYEKGRLKADFEISQKRLENAKNGNLTADQIHQKETEKREVENKKLQLLYGTI